MTTDKPNSHTLRKGRVSLQNQIYLISFVTDGRETYFTDFYCARLVVGCLQKSNHAKTLAFVVMPDHVHWLIQLLGDASLGRAVHAVKSVSARQLNR